MLKSCLSPHTNDIINAYTEGVSACQLAKQYGVTTSTVTSFLIRLGVMEYTPRNERNTSSKADVQRLLQLLTMEFN